MKKEQLVKVTLTEGNPEPVEIMAQAIIRISDAMLRISNSGLSERALVVLIKDYSGVPQGDIRRVLTALKDLKRMYTK